MNTTKIGNYGKLAIFLFVAVIILCAFGFAAEGWQTETPNEPDSGDVVPGDDDDADENKDGTEDNEQTQTPPEPETYVPQYVNPLTGIECDETTAKAQHTAFIFDSGAPMYGISYSDLLMEFPTEDGATRLISFISDFESLGKIGSLAPTRGYISNLALPFGSKIVSLGNDDTVEYTHSDTSATTLDLSKNNGYHYTEYSVYNYTNGHLIRAGLSNSNVSSGVNLTLPFLFNEFDAESITGSTVARSVTIPYSSGSETKLEYSEKAGGVYTFQKNGMAKNDLLTDKAVSFSNVFILFADSVTYETATSTQMVMDTLGKGSGYYVTEGTSTYITWSADENGNYFFYNENGEALTVNRGTSYIGFVKSSMCNQVKIS